MEIFPDFKQDTWRLIVIPYLSKVHPLLSGHF
jgi:hypothetical protein